VRLDFAVWIERMRTPPVRVAAIRALQGLTADAVARHFEVASDGSFSIDVCVALFEATKPAA
jgi:hypothetical protein